MEVEPPSSPSGLCLAPQLARTPQRPRLRLLLLLITGHRPRTPPAATATVSTTAPSPDAPPPSPGPRYEAATDAVAALSHPPAPAGSTTVVAPLFYQQLPVVAAPPLTPHVLVDSAAGRIAVAVDPRDWAAAAPRRGAAVDAGPNGRQSLPPSVSPEGRDAEDDVVVVEEDGEVERQPACRFCVVAPAHVLLGVNRVA
ncbi:hypothetical protein HK405_010094 [Cladochytrium tenue]|nr:hypothetical protein HK405_010094 [Cladochytrium tenue]